MPWTVVAMEYITAKLKRTIAKKGIAEIIIAKHRNGATADIHLRFKKELAKFMDLEVQHNDSFGGGQALPSKMNMDEDKPSAGM